MSGRAILDALTVFRRYEPHTLSAAVAFYLGREHVGAHSALQYAAAAIGVLDEQVRRYDLPTTPDALAATIVEVDVAGKFRRVAGQVAFAFG